MKKLLVVAVLALGLAGCSDDKPEPTTSAAAAVDTGVVQCRKVAETVAANADVAEPTDDQLDAVRGAYEDSGFADIKTTGTAYVDAVKAFMTKAGAVTPAELLVKKSALFSACGRHGVKIVEPVPSMPPLPSFAPPPLPENPYDN